VTHEVLVEVITRLGTCRGESAFRPWLYRSVADHVLTMREPAAEARG
jgi:DNA-directed RNA polymerase specialized sigma24 family protein